MGIIFTVLVGCQPLSDRAARKAWLQEQFVADNRVWLTRDPARVADKFARMAGDPYDLMRGNLAVMLADIARPHVDRPPTRFLRSAAATTTLIFGDPHPENAAVCGSPDGADAAVTIEYMDLDAAEYGPWTLDLRRAALGWRTLAAQLDGCRCEDDVVDALIDGYLDALIDGEQPQLQDRDTAEDLHGEVVEDLFDEAGEEGLERRRFYSATTLGPEGQRRLVIDSEVDPKGKAVLDLTGAERAQAERLLERWARDRPPGFRVLDVARRFGVGVSSRPAVRYVFVWDLGDPGEADDQLAQVREVIDPPAFPGRAPRAPHAFETNGQRAAWTAARLWSLPDADPLNGSVEDGAQSFKSQSWWSWIQDFDREDIVEEWEEGDYTPDDIAALARTLGLVLGGAHGRGDTLGGLPSRGVILEDLSAGGGEPALRAELGRMAAADHRQLLVDHVLFKELLHEEGWLLGADRIGGGLP